MSSRLMASFIEVCHPFLLDCLKLKPFSVAIMSCEDECEEGKKSDEEKALLEKEDFKLKETSKLFSLDRQSTLWRSASFILAYTIFEIAKQLGNYTLTTQNGDKYPVPTTFLVVATEVLKLIMIIICSLIGKYTLVTHGFSFKYAVPAACYFFTNIIYLYALTLTAPPIWIILIQTRTLYTALLYKVVFGREVTRVQMVGCVFIVASIFLTRISEMHSGHLTISFQLFLLSQCASLLSSVACLAVEILLKNDTRSFLEQQMWLYIWGGTFASFAVLVTQSPSNFTSAFLELQGKPGITGLVIFSILTSACAGLCVPVIVRNLDSIVKDYVAALNNMLLALLTAVLFPLHFPVNFVYVISLGCLILGIVLYERKKISSFS